MKQFLSQAFHLKPFNVNTWKTTVDTIISCSEVVNHTGYSGLFTKFGFIHRNSLAFSTLNTIQTLLNLLHEHFNGYKMHTSLLIG